MSLAALTGAIVTTLSSRLTPVRVKEHGGSFTERELALLLGEAPCLLVSPIGLADFGSNHNLNGWQATARFTVYCLSTDANGHRADAAKDQAQAVLNLLLEDQDWGLPTQCDVPVLTSLRAENLYSGKINVLSVALWAVSWEQLFIFTTP